MTVQKEPKTDTITGRTKVRLGSVIALVLFIAQAEAVVLLAWWNLSAKVDRVSESYVTEVQARQWIYDAGELNPQVRFPRLPEKRQTIIRSEGKAPEKSTSS